MYLKTNLSEASPSSPGCFGCLIFSLIGTDCNEIILQIFHYLNLGLFYYLYLALIP